ncbi:MAG: M56 family metallopeptidase [Rhodothermia bacterium]|nr:M56 family metallopeptidase [Rhodothermia bacterium]
MEIGIEFLDSIGRMSVGAFWLPLTAWSVVAAAALMATERVETTRPHLFHALHVALLFALPVGITVGLLLKISVTPLSEPLRLVTTLGEIQVGATPDPSTTAKHPLTGFAFIGLITLVAAMVGIARLVHLGVLTARLRRYLADVCGNGSHQLTDQVARWPELKGAGPYLRVYASPKVSVPMTTGVFRPVILLPQGIVSNRNSLRIAVLHEAVHIRRGDFVVRWFCRLVESMFAFNPLVGRVRRNVEFFSESACDMEVLSSGSVSRSEYARLLLGFATTSQSEYPVPGLAAAPSELKRRLLLMTNVSRITMKRISRTTSVLAFAVTLSAVALLVAACTEAGPSSEVFTTVETMPELEGGLASIQQELAYPEIAKKAGVEGRVVVQFVVDERGVVTDPKVVRGVGSGLDEEALRVVRRARFEPGMQAGKPVKVQLSLPITFKLDDSSSDSKPPTTTSALPPALPDELADVDEGPVLIGGLESIIQEIKYPEVAREAGVEGRVVVSFTVDESGSVTSPEIVQSVGSGLDAEAIRVTRTARFRPAMKDGKPVKARLALPINFKL